VKQGKQRKEGGKELKSIISPIIQADIMARIGAEEKDGKEAELEGII
jgi:hypothetical protein